MRKLIVGASCLIILALALESCKPNPINQQAGRDTVILKQMKFNPSLIEIHRGDTVVFINQDLVAHNVTDQTNKEWSSGTIQTGASWETVPAGNVSYYCSIHVVMKGKIVTKE